MMRDLIPHEQIERSIHLLRRQKVMLSTDLAKLCMELPLERLVKPSDEIDPTDVFFEAPVWRLKGW
jgi:hypothetical protein